MEGPGLGADVPDRECGLEADRDSCGGDGRLAAATFVASVVASVVVTVVVTVALDVVKIDPGSEALVGLGPFVGREVPHAAVMTVTRAIATPTGQRRPSVDADRPA